MSIPEPKQALEGHCSAINNNTLYVYSPSGLQSLQLKENATWVEEKSGTSVTGAACVKAAAGGDPALYVIGGEADDDDEYPGLQRYLFGTKTWETLSPPGFDLKGRTNHSAAYLSDSQSILVYAGSTPEAPSYLSSQTFLISTTEPYNIESFVSSAAPANQPILLPWSATQAMMAGGSSLSNVVYTFDREAGWQQLGTNLSEPLDPGVRATLIQGSDGSKVLETYDMTSSPNKVTQTVLLGAGGETAPNGQVVGQQTSSKEQKRDLTLDNWPSYNNTNAPSASRSDYAVAQDSEGLTVLSGGNEDEPVAMFDQNKNSWVDAGKFFGVQKMKDQQPLQPSTTSESTPSATSSAEPEASTTKVASGGMSAHDRSMRTLGITLGTLCGVAALVLIALLFLRWRKSKKVKEVAAAGHDDEKTDRSGERLSFADRGASFMKEAGGSATDLGVPPRHRFDPNAAGSHSSLAIIGGKFNNKRNTNTLAPKGSFESTTNLVKDRNGGEPMEMMDIGEKKHLSPEGNNHTIPSLNVLAASPEDRRTSGWSKYFSTSQPKELEHMPSAYAKDRDSVASQWPSTRAPSSSDVSRIPSSVLVPPLDVDFSKTVDGQRLSNVIAHSPSFADSREDLASRGSTVQGQKGQIEDGDRPISNTTVSSYDRSTMSSDYYNGMSTMNSPWTPFSNANDQRPTSSVYTESIADRRIPSRAARSQGSGFFPGAGTAPRAPAKLRIHHEAKDSAEWPAARDAGKDSPLLNSPPPMASPAYPPPAHDRASTATVFPHEAGNRWTANMSKDTLSNNKLMSQDNLMSHDLAPPRAPGLMNSAKPAAARDSTVTIFPNDDGAGNWSANSKNDLGDLRPPGALGDARAAHDRDSTVTMFPRGVPSAYYANRPKEIDEAEAGKKPMSSDMSWLNLGDNAGPGATRTR
jgi:hypothetical protein